MLYNTFECFFCYEGNVWNGNFDRYKDSIKALQYQDMIETIEECSVSGNKTKLLLSTDFCRKFDKLSCIKILTLPSGVYEKKFFD